MKKVIRLLTITALTAILYSCQKTEYDAPYHFSDIMFTTSTGNNNNSTTLPISLSKGFYITFFDVSQGAISHQWSITGQDGLKFLSPGFSSVSADSLNRQSHILSDSICTNYDANIYLQKEGIYTLTWKNVYKDSVGYMTFPSVKDSITKNWVFKRVFSLKVYGPMTPVVTITKNSTLAVTLPIDTIRLVIGDNLTFGETSKGYPDTRTWTINGGTPSSGTTSTFTTVFNNAGIYKSSLLLSRTVGLPSSLISSLSSPLPVIKVQ